MCRPVCGGEKTVRRENDVQVPPEQGLYSEKSFTQRVLHSKYTRELTVEKLCQDACDHEDGSGCKAKVLKSTPYRELYMVIVL